MSGMMLQVLFLFIPMTPSQVPCLVEKRFSFETRAPISFSRLSPDGWLGTFHQNNLKVFDPFEPKVFGPFEPRPKPRLFVLEGFRSATHIKGKPDLDEGIPFSTFTFGDSHQVIFIGDRDGNVYGWNPSASPKPVLLTKQGKRVERLWVNPGGKLLVIDFNDGKQRFWDLAEKKEKFTFYCWISTVGFSPNGGHIFMGTSKEVVALDSVSFKELWRKKIPLGFLSSLGVSPDGKFLIVCCDSFQGGVIYLLDPGNGQTLREEINLKTDYELPFRTELRFPTFPQARISPEGCFLACSYDSPEVQLWELATMRKAYSFAGNWEKVNGMVFTHSKRLITTSQHADACLWDLSRNRVWRGHEWDGLMSWDPMTGVAATEYYCANPKEFLKTLGEKPLVLQASQPKQISALIQNLKKPVGYIREGAKNELIGLGEHVETALRQALANEKDLDGQILIKEILAKVMKVDGLGPHDHRLLRVVFILEKIGTPECLPFLERIEKESSHPSVKTRACQVASRLKNLWEKPENGCGFLGRRVPCT